MKNGLFLASFGTPRDSGGGLVTIRDGFLNGGDEWFLYRGRLDFTADEFTGSLRVSQYKQGNTSVFGGVGDFELQVRGRFAPDTGHLQGHGTTSAAPGQTLTFDARFLGDLAE